MVHPCEYLKYIPVQWDFKSIWLNPLILSQLTDTIVDYLLIAISHK